MDTAMAVMAAWQRILYHLGGGEVHVEDATLRIVDGG